MTKTFLRTGLGTVAAAAIWAGVAAPTASAGVLLLNPFTLVSTKVTTVTPAVITGSVVIPPVVNSASTGVIVIPIVPVGTGTATSTGTPSTGGVGFVPPGANASAN